MQISAFQRLVDDIYGERDRDRGSALTFAWLVEEVGELSKALRGKDLDNLHEEFADAFAWLVSLANVVGVDIEEVAMGRYGEGCPKCGAAPCRCPA